jgi:hypothetical protein
MKMMTTASLLATHSNWNTLLLLELPCGSGAEPLEERARRNPEGYSAEALCLDGGCQLRIALSM